MTEDKNEGEWISDNVRERHFLVDQNFEGWRLDYFLTNRIPRMSRTLANGIIRHGNVELRPFRRAKPSSRLQMHDVVVLRQPLETEQVQDAEASILYADDALMVLDKPAGMLVHESVSTRLNTITHLLRRKGFEEAEPVHRLDRETSGVLVCARQNSYVSRLRGMFATDHPQKVYRALVLDPQQRWSSGAVERLDTPLGPDTSSVLGVRMGRGHLQATTHVRVVRRLEMDWGPMADLEVRIETGRQHQIRIHLALEGTPIAGDKLYSQDDEFFMAICASPQDETLLAQLPFERHALHAWKIGFWHPDDAERWLEVEAPLPKIWPKIWPKS